MSSQRTLLLCLLILAVSSFAAIAGEADINLPPLDVVTFPAFGGLGGYTILYVGLVVCVLGTLYGLWQYVQVRRMPVHQTMAHVSNIIWETCKTYLLQQGRFLIVLWGLIAACIVYYFLFLQHKSVGAVGVSGVKSTEDAQIARAGLAALTAATAKGATAP